MSKLYQGRRHGEAQAVPLRVMEGGQKPDSRGVGEMENTGQELRRRIESGKKKGHYVGSFTMRPEINSNDFGCFWN